MRKGESNITMATNELKTTEMPEQKEERWWQANILESYNKDGIIKKSNEDSWWKPDDFVDNRPTKTKLAEKTIEKLHDSQTSFQQDIFDGLDMFDQEFHNVQSVVDANSDEV